MTGTLHQISFKSYYIFDMGPIAEPPWFEVIIIRKEIYEVFKKWQVLLLFESRLPCMQTFVAKNCE